MAGSTKWNDAAVQQAIRVGVANGLDAASKRVADDLAALISTPGGGKPSPPGDAPNLQTSTLRNSIRRSVDRVALIATVDLEAPYAAALEYGTSRMAPRPYVRRTVLASAGKLAPFFRGMLKP